MQDFTQAEMEQALEIVLSSIAKCEKVQPKFAEGTPQLSLSRNRSKTTNARVKHPEGSTWYKRLTPTIDAMLVCQALLEEELSKREA